MTETKETKLREALLRANARLLDAAAHLLDVLAGLDSLPEKPKPTNSVTPRTEQ